MPRKRIDIAGKRFGKIRVLERSVNKNKWKYICDCGNIKEAFTSDITKGKVKSCGCERYKAKDIIDQRFGRLVARKSTGEVSNMGMKWICECDCGNVVTMPIGKLTTGHTRSCGCLNMSPKTIDKRKETSKKYNVDGTRTVLLKKSELNKNNTSGVTGVTWSKKEGKWRAQIMFKRKNYYLGDFDKIEDATRVRKLAEDKIHGEFLEWYENEYKQQRVVENEA